MSTSYALNRAIDAPAASATPKSARPSLLKRLFASLIEARRRQADQEIARYIALNGGVLTDELERNISRRFGGIVGR